MIKTYKEKLPDWFKSINGKDYFLVLTNDIDSLLTCAYLKKEFGVEIGGYYSFDALYKYKDFDYTDKKAIYVDADMTEKLCFGNHVPIFTNSKAINLNQDISMNNYTSKYAGSTLMMVLSLYGFDFNGLTPEQIAILISIDSHYLGFYNPSFRPTFEKWHKIMEFENIIEFLDDFDKEKLDNLQAKYKLKNQFNIKQGKIFTGGVKINDLIKIFDCFDIGNLNLNKYEWIKKHDYEVVFNQEINQDKYKIISGCRNYKNATIQSYTKK